MRFQARNSRWRGTEFIAPHAITIDHVPTHAITTTTRVLQTCLRNRSRSQEDNLWLVDDSAHTITKCDRHGNRLMMLLPEGASVAEGGSSAYMAADGSMTGVDEDDTAGAGSSPVVLTTEEEMAPHVGQPHKPPPRHSGRMFVSTQVSVTTRFTGTPLRDFVSEPSDGYRRAPRNG